MARKRQRPTHRIPISKYPFTPGTYPGRRPRFSFFFTSKGVYRLQLRTLKQFLKDRDLPPLDERYAILAYGSNASPGQLLRKYRDHGLDNVPVLFGRLVAAEPVYAHRATVRDHYVPSTLARNKGSRPSWITLLTADQLGQMDASEGRPNSYELTRLTRCRFLIGKKRVDLLYAYVNIPHGVMVRKGKPVSLRSARQKRAKRLLDETTEHTAAHWLDYVIIPNPHPPGQYSSIGR